MNLNERSRRLLLLAGAAGFVVWGAMGLCLGPRRGFSGGLYTPEYTVPGVLPGSAAAKAGFEPGDRVISVEGIPVERLGMESRWPRSLAPGLGDSRRFLVERKSGRVLLNVQYGPPPRGVLSLRLGPAIFGFSFLGLGLWTLVTVRSRPAQTLAQIGFAGGIAAATGLGPHLGGFWNGVQDHVSAAAAVLMFVLLLRFFVTFPRPKPVGDSRAARYAVLGTWICLVAFLIVELVVHPALYYTTGSVISPLVLAYGILIRVAIGHTLTKTPRAELHASGVDLIVGGLVAPLIAIAAAFVSGARFPGWAYALATVSIPLTMAIAVRGHARLEEAGAR